MDKEFWKQYREFQQELEALKRDLERINEVRRELAELGAMSSVDIAF